MEMTVERLDMTAPIIHSLVRRWSPRIPDEEYDDLLQVARLGLLTAKEFDEDRGMSFESFTWLVVNHTLSKHWQKSLRRRCRDERFFRVRRPSAISVEPGFADVELRNSLERLTERQQRMIAMRVAGCKQQDIATAEGISQMHVSRLLRAAFDKLNDGYEMKGEG